MKNTGLYAVIVQNSSQKTTWKQYGFDTFDEQLNLIFSVMLYIMEQSLKEENCTMDDIGAYLDTVNSQYFKKNISYDQCRLLGDFIVNIILSNEGRPMYFYGYSFEQGDYQAIHISYVANRIVYTDQDMKRTSYYLTDDGYSLLLSTLEIENNMKLTIHEMIFQMHLEKQSYDKAVDEIKNVFNLLRIQLQKIQEAMEKIRRNALDYSVKDYEEILLGNLDTLSNTKEKFQNYREMVKRRMADLENENINVRRLSPEEDEKLNNLKIIRSYLNRAIDEHQKILGSHFDLKALYTRELEQLSQVSLIQRFSLRNDFYDKILKMPDSLARLELFLRPLFNREPEKAYNLNKAFQLQKPVGKNQEADEAEELDFDEEAFQMEQERERQEKLKRYRGSLEGILAIAWEKGKISLEDIEGIVKESPDKKEAILPEVNIFKEIMVELIRNREIDIEALKKEKSEFIQDAPGGFQLNEMLLSLVEENPDYEGLAKIEVYRAQDESSVVFGNVKDGSGKEKTIRCSNVWISVTKTRQ